MFSNLLTINIKTKSGILSTSLLLLSKWYFNDKYNLNSLILRTRYVNELLTNLFYLLLGTEPFFRSWYYQLAKVLSLNSTETLLDIRFAFIFFFIMMKFKFSSTLCPGLPNTTFLSGFPILISYASPVFLICSTCFVVQLSLLCFIALEIFGKSNSNVLKSKQLENTTYRKLDMCPSSRSKETPILLGPLERANPNHWTPTY